MKRSFAAAGFAAVLALSAAVHADVAPSSAVDGNATGGFAQTNPPPSGGTMAPFNANVHHPYFGWAGIGFYDVRISVDVPGFGSVSGSSGYFGINAGAAYDLLVLAPNLPFSVFGNVAFAFGGDIFLPISAGAAVHYDALPVQLFGGLAFTIMPHTGGGDTPIGVGIFLMGSYPLPQIRPGLSAYAQFQYHFMDDSFNLLVFNVGAELGF